MLFSFSVSLTCARCCWAVKADDSPEIEQRSWINVGHFWQNGVIVVWRERSTRARALTGLCFAHIREGSLAVVLHALHHPQKESTTIQLHVHAIVPNALWNSRDFSQHPRRTDGGRLSGEEKMKDRTSWVTRLCSADRGPLLCRGGCRKSHGAVYIVYMRRHAESRRTNPLPVPIFQAGQHVLHLVYTLFDAPPSRCPATTQYHHPARRAKL